MIQMQTELLVADNSGAKLVKCIKVLGGSHRRYANIGDVIKVSIQEAIPRSKVQAGKVFNAVVVRTRSGVRRKDGTVLKFGTNAVALLDNQLQLMGTRISGPAPHELRKRFMKLISLARVVV